MREQNRRRRKRGGFWAFGCSCSVIALVFFVTVITLAIVLPIVLSPNMTEPIPPSMSINLTDSTTMTTTTTDATTTTTTTTTAATTTPVVIGPILELTQTATLVLGPEDMLNAGDVVKIVLEIQNVGDTPLDIDSTNFSFPLMCMSNLTDPISAGYTVTCMGLYLVTQIDIADGRILDVNNTVNDQSIFSQVDLSQMSFPNITSNTMIRVDNETDTATVKIKIVNTGTETLLNVTVEVDDGMTFEIPELLPADMDMFEYNYTIVNADIAEGVISRQVNTTAIGFTSLEYIMYEESSLDINITDLFQIDPPSVQVLSAFFDATPMDFVGSVVGLTVTIENMPGAGIASNVVVTDTVYGSNFICEPANMDNTIAAVFPGETRMCVGTILLTEMDFTPLFSSPTLSPVTTISMDFSPDVVFPANPVSFLPADIAWGQTLATGALFQDLTTGFSGYRKSRGGSAAVVYTETRGSTFAAGSGVRDLTHPVQRRVATSANAKVIRYLFFNIHPRHTEWFVYIADYVPIGGRNGLFIETDPAGAVSQVSLYAQWGPGDPWSYNSLTRELTVGGSLTKSRQVLMRMGSFGSYNSVNYHYDQNDAQNPFFEGILERLAPP